MLKDFGPIVNILFRMKKLIKIMPGDR